MLNNVLSIIAVAIGAAFVLLAYMAAAALTWPLIVGAWLAVAILSAGGLVLVYERWSLNDERQLRARAEAEKIQAEAAKIRREAEVTAITAPAGHQIVMNDTRTETYWRSPHIDPRRYANGPGGALPSPDELAVWLEWTRQHATVRPSNVRVEPPPATLAIESPAQLPPILPVLDQAQRLLIVGGSDSGKSTLAKHLIATRKENSRVVVIDPHAPSKLLGLDVIGAGRDYAAIGNALESLLWLMTDRYNRVKDGSALYGQFDRVSICIDEWTGIARNVDGAGDMLALLLVESRKVGIHLAVLSHSDDVKTLGIEGQGQLRSSFTVARLFGGNGQPRRVFIDPPHKTGPDGRKLEPVEYALPGQFQGHPQVPAGQLVLELPTPPSREARSVLDALDGEPPAGLYALGKRAGIGGSKPTVIKRVRDALDELGIDEAEIAGQFSVNGR